MFPTSRLQFSCWITVVCALAALSTSCGSSSNISQAQAQAISHEVVTATEAAVTAAIPASSAAERRAHPSLANVVKALRPDQLSGCTTSGSSESCNWPINYTGPCPDGGTIGVVGDLSITLDSSGSGSNAFSLAVTPTNCGVQSDLTVNGSVQLSTTVNFADDQIAYPVDFLEKGGLTYGPHPSGSCTVNVTYTINSATSCTVSGTMCGQSLSGDC